MKLETILTIDCDELGDGSLIERFNTLHGTIRETGAVVVRLTGAYGIDAALKDYAQEKFAKDNIIVL